MARTSSRSSFRSLSKGILEASWEFDPTRGVGLGLHRYDGRLPVYTKATIARRIARVRSDLARLDRATGGDGLEGEAALEAGVLRSLLLKERFTLADAQSPRKAPMYTLGKLNIVNYLLRNYAPLNRRIQGIAKLQAGVPAYVDRFRALAERSLAETQYEMAELAVGGMIEAYERESCPRSCRTSAPEPAAAWNGPIPRRSRR